MFPETYFNRSFSNNAQTSCDCFFFLEWFFTFGFVMPNSTNSWQQTIDAAAPEEMLSAEALSGNVVFETSFYDGDEFMCKNSVRIYYV